MVPPQLFTIDQSPDVLLVFPWFTKEILGGALPLVHPESSTTCSPKCVCVCRLGGGGIDLLTSALVYSMVLTLYNTQRFWVSFFMVMFRGLQ